MPFLTAEMCAKLPKYRLGSLTTRKESALDVNAGLVEPMIEILHEPETPEIE